MYYIRICSYKWILYAEHSPPQYSLPFSFVFLSFFCVVQALLELTTLLF